MDELTVLKLARDAAIGRATVAEADLRPADVAEHNARAEGYQRMIDELTLEEPD